MNTEKLLEAMGATLIILAFIISMGGMLYNLFTNPPQPRKVVEMRFREEVVKEIKHEYGWFTSTTAITFDNDETITLSGIHAVYKNIDGISRFKWTERDGWKPMLPGEPSRK